MTIDFESVIGMALFSKAGGVGRDSLLETIATIAVLILASMLRNGGLERANWLRRLARWSDGCCVRIVSYRRLAASWGVRDVNGNDTNNRLLQKAIMFRVSSTDREWATTHTSLADAIIDSRSISRPDGTVPEMEFDCRYKIVNLPPYDQWVRLGDLDLGVSFKRSKHTRDSGDTKVSDEMEIYYIKGSRHAVDKFIDKSLADYKRAIDTRQSGKRFLYMPYRRQNENSEIAYKRYALSNERTFAELFIPDKESIISLVDRFAAKQGKFAVPGHPHKLGFLLEGPPGTGKTSFIKALAHHTGRHVVYVCLSKIKTNQELMRMMFEKRYSSSDLDEDLDFDEVIFVMEDVDAAGDSVKTRSRYAAAVASSPTAQAVDRFTDDTDRLNLAGVLNALDGIVDSPGRIVVMTSNHSELLDPALVRPGRVNMRVRLGHIRPQEAAHMTRRYFGDDAFTDGDHRLEWFANNDMSPAHLEALCVHCATFGELMDSLVCNGKTI